MTSRDFCYWLQGCFEIGEAGRAAPLRPDGQEQAVTALSHAQVTVIKQHLALVFKHEIDPSMGDAAHQAALSEIHTPPKTATPPNPFTHGGGPLIRC